VSLTAFTKRSVDGAPAVEVAFDDFRVTRGLVDCP